MPRPSHPRTGVVALLTVLVAVASHPVALADPWLPQGSVTTTGGAPRTWPAVVQLPGGSLLAAGGTPLDAAGENGAVQLRYPNGAWIQTAALDGPKIGQAAGIDALGRVIIYGGWDPVDGDTGNARPYDQVEGFTGDIAQRAGNAPKAYNAYAVDSQHRLYVIGGNNGQSGNSSTYADRFDAITDSWTVLAPMLTPVRDAAGVCDDRGRVLVIGGLNTNGASRTANVASYDIGSNTWSNTALPDLPVPTSGLRAVLGADNRVYAMGGETGPVGAGTIVASVWVLDLNTNTWAANPGGDMITARSHFGAVLDTTTQQIFVIGGETAAGGTNLCESLYTPPCPAIAADLLDTTAWAGSTAGLAASFSGGHDMSYQWYRGAVALNDGDLGGRVSGATTSALAIAGVQPADAGAYHLVATNPCGSATSSSATLAVLQPPNPSDPAKWSWHSLHPAGSPGASAAYAVAGGRVAGYITTGPNPLYPQRAYFTHAATWSRPAGQSTFVLQDLNNPATVQSGAQSISPDGTLIVGFWYRPYHTPQGWGFFERPYTWRFNPDGSVTETEVWCQGEYGLMRSSDGIRSIGNSFGDWDDPSYQEYWGPAPAPSVPAGAAFSYSAVGMGMVLGTLNGHATAWSAGQPIDMNPPGASSSAVYAAAEGQSVGIATFAGVSTGVIWGGTSAQAITSLGAGGSVTAVSHGVQVGVLGNHASLWTGTAAGRVDLHMLLPAPFTTSVATGVWFNQANGEILATGTGFNTVSGTYEAVAWAYNPAGTPACPADFNGQGGLTVQDIFDFLGAYFNGDIRADFNASNDVTVQDIFDFLAAYFAAC